MTSWECYENKWFYMKYIGKYLSVEMVKKLNKVETKLFENYTKKKLYVFLHLMLIISWKSDKEWLQENILKINVDVKKVKNMKIDLKSLIYKFEKITWRY
jgi:hypothetical protein